jgi:hypothetical protein
LEVSPNTLAKEKGTSEVQSKLIETTMLASSFHNIDIAISTMEVPLLQLYELRLI